jgi:hypothetical protein
VAEGYAAGEVHGGGDAEPGVFGPPLGASGDEAGGKAFGSNQEVRRPPRRALDSSDEDISKREERNAWVVKRRFAEADDEVRRVIKGRLAGTKARLIRSGLGLTFEEFATVRKRLQRLARKLRLEGSAMQRD